MGLSSNMHISHIIRLRGFTYWLKIILVWSRCHVYWRSVLSVIYQDLYIRVCTYVPVYVCMLITSIKKYVCMRICYTHACACIHIHVCCLTDQRTGVCTDVYTAWLHTFVYICITRVYAICTYTHIHTCVCVQHTYISTITDSPSQTQTSNRWKSHAYQCKEYTRKGIFKKEKISL
jgi:hypothetical protein